MAREYGTSQAAPPAREGIRSSSARFAVLLGLVAVVSVAAAVLLAGAHGGGSALLSPAKPLADFGRGLSQDSAEIKGIADEVDADQLENDALSKKMAKLHDHAAKKHCSCDCSGMPELRAQAARSTMLEQVGENTFLGPCSECACMQSNDIQAMVAALSLKLDKEVSTMTKIDKDIDPKIPVDIVVRVGRKGQPGAPGPKGFKGPDGEAGAVGPRGKQGPQGDQGPKGPTGPTGIKGEDGIEGRIGEDGPKGASGPPGRPGTEGAEGPQGRVGDPGADGANGADGLPGPEGDPGAPGLKGPPGPKGVPGPPGPKGVKGEDGGTGTKGASGPAGSDGAPGNDGSSGPKGYWGKGCDGVIPTDGSVPKVIDACGVCGGDESECARTTVTREAYAVGDPHYRTFDGKTFDYQLTGEFILARHNNDIEFQNKQLVCPNPSVRCNNQGAVVTKNWNMVFKGEWWDGKKFLLNGRVMKSGIDYTVDQWTSLDATTSFLVGDGYFHVSFTDNPKLESALVEGYWTHWDDWEGHRGTLPGDRYGQFYFRAPGRWSSGLSMTGLFANFNNDAEDDWDSISPSTLWWVENTPSSAFSNNEYRMHWTNRIQQSKEQKRAARGSGTVDIREGGGHKAPTSTLGTATMGTQEWDAVDWTAEQEKAALREVDPLTARMRKRLFAKMASERVIERRVGEAKPTSELARAELDIMPNVGERPSRLRVVQQLMFRKEWKHLDSVQRGMMLAGQVVSNNAKGFSHMCQSCVRGSEECAEKKIIETPEPDGITYGSAEMRTTCINSCFNWLTIKNSKSICACWIDCSLSVPPATCTKNLIDNYFAERRVLLTPDDGKFDERCLSLTDSPSRTFKGDKPGARKRWEMEFAPNFGITFWWKPDMNAESGTYKLPGRKGLLYKGLNQTDTGDYGMPSTKMVYIAVDSDGSSKQLVVTVAGVESKVPADSCQSLGEDVFTFIAVTKRNTKVTVWCGISGGENAVKVHSFQLDGAEYKTSMQQVIAVGGIGLPDADKPKGWMGRLNYFGVDKWDPEGKIPLWDDQIPKRFAMGEPAQCPS